MSTLFRTKLQNSIFLIVFPLVYILIGALFEFVPDVTPRTISHLFAACIIVLGIIMIARYFLQNSFRNLYSYDFSFGTFAVIVGICMMVSAERIATDLTVLLGVCMLMSSIIKVQNAIQLISMKKKFWIPVLTVAVLLIAADILVLINPFGEDKRDVWLTYTNYLLMVDGVLSLAINIVMHVFARQCEKAAELAAKASLASSASVPPQKGTIGGVADKPSVSAGASASRKNVPADPANARVADQKPEQPADQKADRKSDVKSDAKSDEKSDVKSDGKSEREKSDGEPSSASSDETIRELFDDK